jgi:hypothetical protein
MMLVLSFQTIINLIIQFAKENFLVENMLFVKSNIQRKIFKKHGLKFPQFYKTVDIK